MTTDLRERFAELPAVNYNLYFGSKEISEHENALSEIDAMEQILDFIALEKQRTREETLKEVLVVLPDRKWGNFGPLADWNSGWNLCRDACIAAITGLRKEK